MDVLVLGGTGYIGTALVDELVDRGHHVAALSRDPDDETELPEGVEAIAGDVTDLASIEDAFAGQDAVVNLVALSPLFDAPAGAHERVHLGGTKNAIEAAETHDVDRFVQLSALGADPDGPTEYLRTKGQAERVVEDAAVPSVILRPSVVFGPGGEFVEFTKRTKHLFAPYLPVAPLPGGGSTPFQPIALEDFVPMLASAVEEDEHVGETYELGGPEVLTLADVTRMVYDAEGKRMYVLPVPMPLARIGIGMLGLLPPFPFGLDQYRSLKVDNTVSNNDVGAFDVDPDDLLALKEYLERRH